VAFVARDGAHVGFDFFLDPAALRIAEAALEVIDDALEVGLIFSVAVFARALQLDFLPFGTVQENIDDLRRELTQRRIERKAVMLCKTVHIHCGYAAALHRPAAALQAALADGQALVRDDQIRIDLHEHAETGALGARARRVIEGEHAGRQLLDARPMLGAGVVLRKEQVFPIHHADDHQAVGQRGRGFCGIGQTRANVGPNDQTVDHNVDRVLLVLFELDGFGKIIQNSVHPNADKAAATGRLQLLDMLALARADDRSQHLDFRALRQGKHPVDDLVDRLLLDLPAADRAVRNADAGIQQTQIIVNFGYGSHCGTRVFRRGLLVDGNRRGQPLNVIHVRFIQLPQKLAGIGRKRFHIAALPLGVNRIKRKGGFSGAGKAGKNHQLVARNLNIDILQVVLSGAFDQNVFSRHTV